MGNVFLQSSTAVARYFFDTEFIEDGRTIDLVSIGIVMEEGLGGYYAVSTEANLSLASPWVRQNVLPQLPPYDSKHWKPRAQIRDEVQRLVADTKGDRAVEFWSYYADYDWVALCQLFGTMMGLPLGFPMYCMDVKNFCVLVGDPRLPKQNKRDKHNALLDAQWHMECFQYLRNHAERTSG